jgi:hypothetical protein
VSPGEHRRRFDTDLAAALLVGLAACAVFAHTLGFGWVYDDAGQILSNKTEEAMSNIRHRAIQALEAHIRQVPEDARARILPAANYATEGRNEDAVREAVPTWPSSTAIRNPTSSTQKRSARSVGSRRTSMEMPPRRR